MQLKANRLFIQTAARDFKQTGAVVPSSRGLAKAMTSELARRRDALVSALEIGGGTGSITAEIVRHLGYGDHLDVYEIDRRMARILTLRLREDKTFPSTRARVSVHGAAIQRIERLPRYDYLFSSLPLNNFEPEDVSEIFEIYRSVLRPGGVCSFYEYILVREAAKVVSGRSRDRARVNGVARVVREIIRLHEFRHEMVIFNVPPALVHHIRFDG